MDKGDVMSDRDLNAQFGKISDTATAAADKVKAQPANIRKINSKLMLRPHATGSTLRRIA